MKYLTYAEYLELGFEEVEEEAKFPLLLKRASYVVDHVTRQFYQHNDLESDHSWRKNGFKRAVATQIEYFDELGGVTSESINSAPQSQQIGRVNVSSGSRSGSRSDSGKRPTLSPDAYTHLEGTGLLNRGIG